MASLVFSALPPALLDTVRADALAAGSAVQPLQDDGPFPVRCCLTDASTAEGVLLLSLQPPSPPSPYSAPGPVYIHAERCAGQRTNDVPDLLRNRTLSLRAYDEQHMLNASTVVDGHDVEEAAEHLLSDRRATYVFVHFAGPGCYACRVDRAA